MLPKMLKLAVVIGKLDILGLNEQKDAVSAFFLNANLHPAGTSTNDLFPIWSSTLRTLKEGVDQGA